MRTQKYGLFAFYFNGGVREIIPIYPLYAVMFGDTGVSAFEISTLFVIWALVGIIFEVPSGALADRFSRKWLIVVSGLLKSSGFLAWFLFQDFAGYAAGFILWGLGSTLRSGAFEALLHDLLSAMDRKGEFTKHYGRIRALGTLGVVAAELSGGLLISQGYDLVLLVSALIPLIATIPFLIIVKDAPKTEEAYEAGYLSILRAGFIETVRSKEILYIFLCISLLVVTFGIYDEYTGLVLQEKGFSLAMIAYLGVPIFLAQSLGHSLAHRVRRLGISATLTVIGLASLTLLLYPFLDGLTVPFLMSLYFFVFGLSVSYLEGELQSQITGDTRATVTSIVGLGDSFGAILWFLVFGAMAEATNMVDASFGLGLSAVVLCTLFKLLATRWKVQTGTQLARKAAS